MILMVRTLENGNGRQIVTVTVCAGWGVGDPAAGHVGLQVGGDDESGGEGETKGSRECHRLLASPPHRSVRSKLFLKSEKECPGN
jgi:hypothetical protein